jgi:hypothetical protein
LEDSRGEKYSTEHGVVQDALEDIDFENAEGDQKLEARR